MSEWEFNAVIEDDGTLCLEWYKGKDNVVTVCLDSKERYAYWAALVDGVPHSGTTKSTGDKP